MKFARVSRHDRGVWSQGIGVEAQERKDSSPKRRIFRKRGSLAHDRLKKEAAGAISTNVRASLEGCG